MHYVRRQEDYIKGTIMKLNYAVSRETISSVYIYIKRSRGRVGI